MRNWLLLTMLLPACGRWGFSEPDAAEGSGEGGGPGDGPADGPPTDIPAGGGTLHFGETPTSDVTGVTRDTDVSSEAGSTGNNYGGAAIMECEAGQKHALLRFDLSIIPTGRTVTNAQLHLTFGGSSSGTVTLRPLLEAWTEGTGSGSPGVANNTQRTATASWTTSGAAAPGSAGAMIAMSAVSAGSITITLPNATVQSWVATPASNFGLELECSADTSISAHENATATARPQLDITHL